MNLGPRNPTSRSEAIARGAAPAVALLGATAWCQPAASGADLWWHLAAGREIWELGGPPAVDHFSFTFEGRPWLNHEWLWDVVFWGLYRLDPQAVAWLNFGLVVALLGILYAATRRESGSALAASVAVWLAAATCHWFFIIRPDMVTLLFVAVVLWTRDRPWRVWLWPPLMVLWANLHGGFLFGLGMIVLWALARSAQSSVANRRPVLPARDCIVVALCLVAWLITPWGLESLDYPLQYLDSGSPYRDIPEWHPPAFSWHPRDYETRYWLLALVALGGLPRALVRSPYLVALSLVTFVMAFTSRRFIPLFAVAAAPLAALAIESARDHATRRLRWLTGPRAAMATTAAGLAVAVLWWQDVRIYPRLLERWTVSDVFPADALHYLKALGPPRRLLNEPDWGGYIMLELPESQVFFDGRANTLYDDAMFLDSEVLGSARPGWKAIVERYAPDAALLRGGTRLSRALVSLQSPWVPVYRDSVAVILLPPGSPLLEGPLPAAATVLAGRVGGYEHFASRALEAGDLNAAIPALERAVKLDPQRIRIHRRLIGLHAARGDAAGVQRTVGMALRENPRRWISLRLAEGRAYEVLGDLPRSLRSFEKALPTAPYVSRSPALAEVKRIRDRIRRARDGDPPARPE